MEIIEQCHGMKLIKKKLSDGSFVFNLLIPNTILEAISEESAVSMFNEISFQFSQAGEIINKATGYFNGSH